MKRIPSLDGLRAISITMVCLGHLTHAGPAPQFLHPYAYTGVLIFFVISGYLITTLLLNEHAKTSTIDLRQFYIRRAYRILPAAAVFMLVIFAIYGRELRWYDITAMLLYLVNFDLARPWMINHLWSLSVEEQFYFLWPTVLKKWYRQRIAILLGAVVFAPIFSTACYYFKFASGGWGMFPCRQFGHWLPACDFEGAYPKNTWLGGYAHAARCRPHSEIWRRHSGAHFGRTVCAGPDPALLNCWTGAARHPISVSDFERCPSHVAGQDQLRSLPVATTVFLRAVATARLHTAFCLRAG